MIRNENDARAFVAARCDAEAMGRLDRFVHLLEAENQRQNLVAATTIASVWKRHIADSGQLLDYVPRETESLRDAWLDLGSGAGFPGLVIAAMRPKWPVVLIESRKRRCEWLAASAQALALDHVTVECRRLEDVSDRGAAVISARAFAPLEKLITLARRFSTRDTVWLLPKGRSASQEVAALPMSLRKSFHVEQSATDVDSGIVVGRIAEGEGE